MNALASLKIKIDQFRGYNRSIKLFLTIPLLFGMYYAIKGLFFNFYLLALGYDKAFLGLANGMAPFATLILAFPLGVLTDRIGRKRSVLIGLILTALGFLAFLGAKSEFSILATLLLSGFGETLYFIAATPLMTRLTTSENRVAVFSLRAALFTFSGMAGSFMGGQMPLWFDVAFQIQPGTVSSYRGILFTCFFLLLIGLVPVMMIPRGDGEARKQANTGEKGQTRKNLRAILKKKVVWQLFLPNLAIGVGAALMVPYLNLFFRETFDTSDQLLGVLFSISSFVTGAGTLFSPWLARKLGGRIHALVMAQGASLMFLLVMGFSPWLGLAVVGFWGRNSLMNMAQPLYNAFSMEQVDENEQGTLSSMLTLSWNTGWALMPLVSGLIQERVGFTPIFIATGVLYAISTALIWFYFKDSDRIAAAVEPVLA